MVDKFLVKLSAAHARKGLNPYQVAKQSGVNINTVGRYAAEDQIVSQISPAVLKLIWFYGMTWEQAVEIVQVSDDTEINSALAAAS